MLLEAVADAGTERAERSMNVLRFVCEHSQEVRRSSQHNF